MAYKTKRYRKARRWSRRAGCKEIYFPLHVRVFFGGVEIGVCKSITWTDEETNQPRKLTM